MTTPLHPALVHLPLGLAFVVPLLAIGFSWAIWKGHIRARSWFMIVFLQALLVAGGLVAMNTGEREEDRVESAVPKQALHEHESLATQFLWAAGITLGIALLPVASRRPSVVRAFTAATVVSTFVVAGAALRAGHAGGQLVYVYNAGSAYGASSQHTAQSDSDLGVKVPKTSSIVRRDHDDD
ncbi:MAG TPA: hypothetical protein VN622_13170 [Clostridia bacterium]|nr:hypothetical protein [Clostridia bacterium]